MVGEFAVPGARLYTETRGSGRLLLLVVGGSGDPAYYAGVADRLAARRTVLTWARRGFVRSPLDGPVPDTAGRIAADVADAAALIRAHGGGPVDVFGSSSGAIVTLELVARHPELVATAVVHEPPILDLLDDPQAWDARFAEIASTYAEQGTYAAMVRFAALIGMPQPADPDAEPVHDPATVRSAENRRFWYAHEFRRQYPALRPRLEALVAVAERIVPAGGRDSRARDALFTATEALAVGLGRPVAELPGGHVGFVEHPEQFAAELEVLL